MKRQPIMVFAGEFWDGASAVGLAEGFRDEGWYVEQIDLNHFFCNVGQSFTARIGNRILAPHAQAAYCNAILQSCETLRPDIFMVIKGSFITAEMIRRIKAAGSRVVMFYPDYHFDHPGVDPATFGLYDLYATTKSFHVDWLRQHLPDVRILFAHHGYIDRVHKPLYDEVGEEELTTDILYVGNHSAYKQRWLAPVRSRFPDARMTIIGARWKDVVSGPLASAVYGRVLSGAAYAQAIQTAKVNIAMHHGLVKNGWSDLVSTRTFEIPASKGFMLHIDNPEIRTLFDVGTEIDVFSTEDELNEKIAYYLARPDLRKAMIEQAYKRCVPAYSYEARSADILARLAQLPLGGR